MRLMVDLCARRPAQRYTLEQLSCVILLTIVWLLIRCAVEGERGAVALTLLASVRGWRCQGTVTG